MNPHKLERVIGVISDTHGLVRPPAIDALRVADLILHAGDVGGPHVLEALKDIAPVVAIRGNVDTGDWATALSERETVEIGGVRVLMLHDLKQLGLEPAGAGFRVVVSGHSHKPAIEERDGVLYVNPGSAGPRRFTLPPSVGLLRVRAATVTAELIELSE